MGITNTELKESVYTEFKERAEWNFIKREVELKKTSDEWKKNGMPKSVFENAMKSWSNTQTEVPKK